MAAFVEFWIAPPEHVGTDVQFPAFPVTVRPPLAPVVLRTMPFTAPFDEMLRNANPLAPMVVFATFSAVPVVVVSVLTMLVLFCVALTVPPPVAVNAALAPVLRFNPPVKLIVAPVLPVSETPVSVSVTAPLNVTPPPVLPAMLIECALPLAIVPLELRVALAP